MSKENKGGTVGPLLIIFLGCIIFCAIGIYLYEQKDKTAFTEIKEKFEVAIKERNAAVAKIDEFNKTMEEHGKAVEALAERITEIETSIKKSNGELDVFRDQIADTREKQHRLREDLSKKQFKTDVNVKVDVPKGPFLVEIVPGKPRPKTTPVGATSDNPTPAPTAPEANTQSQKGLGKGIKAIMQEQQDKKLKKTEQKDK